MGSEMCIRDSKGDRATVDDDFATLNFEIDNNGKITAISWFYYPEQN